MHGNQSFMTSVDDTQFASFVLFLSLLSSKGNLSCHDSLSFGDESTFSTSTILPSTVSFVSLKKVFLVKFNQDFDKIIPSEQRLLRDFDIEHI